MRTNSVVVNARIPEKMKETLRKVVEKGLYVNMSDFIREAVREKLEKIEVKVLV